MNATQRRRGLLEEAQANPSGVLCRSQAPGADDDELLQLAAAVALRQLGRIEESLERFDHVLRSTTEPEVEVEARKRRAVALAYHGELDRGLDDLEQLARVAPLHHHAEIAHQRAGLLQLAGRAIEARASYEEVIRRWWDDLTPLWRGHALMNLGILAAYDGDITEALDLLRRAGRSYDDADQPVLSALAVENEAWVRGFSGQTAIALEMFDRVDAELEERFGLCHETRAATRAEVYLRGGLVRRAVTALQDSIDFLRRDGNHLLAAETMVVLAEAQLRAMDPVAARASAEAGRRELLSQGRTGWAILADGLLEQANLWLGAPGQVTDTHVDLIRQLTDAGHTSAARRLAVLLLAAFPHDQRVADATADLEMFELPSLDVARLAVGRAASSAEPFAILEEAYRIIDARADQLGACELQPDVQRAVGQLAEWALRRRLTEGADHTGWADRRRLVALCRWPSTDDAEFTALLGKLRAATSRERHEVRDPQERRILAVSIGELRRAVSDRAIKVAARRHRPAPPDCEGRSPIDVCVLDNELVVSRPGTKTARVSSAAIEALRAHYERWCISRGGDRLRDVVASADRVDAMLAPFVDGDATSIVVDAALRSVPWALLPTLRGLAFSLMPARGMARPPGQQRLAQHEQWVCGPGLATDAFENVWRRGLNIDGHSIASTTAEALAGMNGASVVYIAAHGRVEPGNPFFGGIELADGELLLHDLSRLASPPTGVVLSSCYGSAASAAEIDTVPISLVDAFLAIGTEWVVAAGAALPDEPRLVHVTSAVQSMVSAGTTPASALRTLRIRHRDDLTHPIHHFLHHTVVWGTSPAGQPSQSVA